MRNKFSEELVKIANKNKSVHIVVADISPAGSMEKFQKKFKNRFINVGVSEQAMIGMLLDFPSKKLYLHIQLQIFSL